MLLSLTSATGATPRIPLAYAIPYYKINLGSGMHAVGEYPVMCHVRCPTVGSAPRDVA